MTTKTLLNHYLYEVKGKTVNVDGYEIEDSDVCIFGKDGKTYYIPLLDYITFVFNKSKS